MMNGMDLSLGSQYQHLHLPPGFRFHPTDEELVVHHLMKKASSLPLHVAIIAEIDLYKFDPWELQNLVVYAVICCDGLTDVGSSDTCLILLQQGLGFDPCGVKKALVFYGGKPPKGVKTNWIMHEFRLPHNPSKPPSLTSNLGHCTKKNSLRLDDWVLCRIYKKSYSNTSLLRPLLMEQEKELSMETMLPTMHHHFQEPKVMDHKWD